MLDLLTFEGIGPLVERLDIHILYLNWCRALGRDPYDYKAKLSYHLKRLSVLECPIISWLKGAKRQ